MRDHPPRPPRRGGEAVPAGLNPTPGQKEPPGSLHGEQPSAAAELWVIKVPAGDQPAMPGTQAHKPAGSAGRMLTMLRRVGIGAGLRVTVPPGDAGEMISMIRCIIVSLIWGATVTGTLAIGYTARLPAAVIFAIVVLEFAGLLAAMRNTRRKDK